MNRATLLAVAAVLAAAVGLFALPGSRARCIGPTTACKSNLKSMGVALEMYSTDFQGLYPSRLQDVTPGYLKTLPTCPSGSPYYFYEVSPAHRDYTVTCAGQVHSAVLGGPWDPSYTSRDGLVERGRGPALTPAEAKRVRAFQRRQRFERFLDDLAGNGFLVLAGIGVAVYLVASMIGRWAAGGREAGDG